MLLDLSDTHAHQLMSESGIPRGVAQAHGWRSVTEAQARRLLDRPDVASGGILMAYPGCADGFFRLRLDQPLPTRADGHPAKYLQPRGTTPRLFIPALPVVERALATPGTELWVTEGEKKALCAALHGIPCVGIGGVWNWGRRPSSTDSVIELLPDWHRVGVKGRKIVLVGDSDLAGRPPNDAAGWALRTLARALRVAGAVWVTTLILPGATWAEALDGQSKTGLDDYLALQGHSPGDLRRLAQDEARGRMNGVHRTVLSPVGAIEPAVAARMWAAALGNGG